MSCVHYNVLHFGEIRVIGNQKPIEFNKQLFLYSVWGLTFSIHTVRVQWQWEKFIEQTNLHSWTEHLFTFYLFLILIYSHKFCFILQVIESRNDDFFLIPWNHRMIQFQPNFCASSNTHCKLFEFRHINLKIHFSHILVNASWVELSRIELIEVLKS